MSMSSPVGRPAVEVSVNVQNEQLILATMMHDKIILRDLSSRLDPGMFIGKRHKIIFEILRDISFQRLTFDLEIFEQLGKNKNYGGRKYITDLTSAYPNPPKNLEFHLDKLKIDSIKFYLRIGRLQELIDLSSNPNATLSELSEVVQAVQRDLSGKIQGDGIKGGYSLYTHYLSDFKARRKASNFVPTGFDWLDESLTEGLARKKMSIVTARPAMGKSTFALNIAYRISNRYGISVLHLPIEMGEIPTMDSMISLHTGIEVDKLIKFPHKMSRNDLDIVNKAAYSITENEKLNFCTSGIKFEQLPNLINDGGYAVVIFDLWEKLVPKKEQGIIAEYLDKTQQMMKDCDCHGMLVHQTKRGVENRQNKRPTMEDLKNSGGYEECVDLIMSLYRDCYYNPSIKEDVLEVNILKQRRGAAAFNPHYFQFEGHISRVGKELRGWCGSEDYE